MESIFREGWEVVMGMGTLQPIHKNSIPMQQSWFDWSIDSWLIICILNNNIFEMQMIRSIVQVLFKKQNMREFTV